MTSALGTITRSDKMGAVPSAPLFVDRISFLGPSTYATGGSPAFKAAFQAITKDGRVPIAVIGQDCGDNHPEYDEATDKLKLRVMSTGVEVADTTNLSGVTFNVIVISQ